MHSPSDPLGVRTGARFVMSRARHVAIDDAAVRQVAEQIGMTEAVAGDWATEHLGEIELDDAALANYVLVLDALNFYFWGHPRWRVTYPHDTHNGYWALTLALRRALNEGVPITDASYLAEIPAEDVALLLRGESVIPRFSARVANLREVGRGLLDGCDGTFLTCVRRANGSGIQLLREVVTRFPSFVDVSRFQSRTIPFYKRAQILVSDVAAAFRNAGPGAFQDLHLLTAFADYKVPQVLEQLGVLRYSNDLVQRLIEHDPIARHSDEEVEIRAGTIIAIEQINQCLAAGGRRLTDYEIDWYLWNLGQATTAGALPYHRTPTLAY